MALEMQVPSLELTKTDGACLAVRCIGGAAKCFHGRYNCEECGWAWGRCRPCFALLKRSFASQTPLLHAADLRPPIETGGARCEFMRAGLAVLALRSFCASAR